MCIISAFIVGISQAGLALAPDANGLIISLVILAASSSVLKVVMGSMLTKAAGGEAYGGVLGLADSIFSVCRAGAPFLSGVLVEYVGPTAPGLLGCGYIFTFALIAAPYLLPQPHGKEE